MVLPAWLLTAWFHSWSLGQACDKFFVPPANIDGLEITETHTGSVGKYGSAFTSCSITSAADAAWLGSSGPFTYTLRFSAPVKQLTMQITATGNPGEESFTFITNNGKPDITTTNSCYTKVIGNQIFSGLDSPGNGGGGIFVIKNQGDFTELTISGNGGLNGSLFSFCANVVKGNCLENPLRPLLTQTKIIAACQSPVTNLETVKANNLPRGSEITWHSDSVASRLNRVTAQRVISGKYYAAFYDKKEQCYSKTTAVEVAAVSGPKVSAGPDLEVCSGETVTLSASGALSYSWDNEVRQGVAFNPTLSKIYTVTGTDANGCTGSDQLYLKVRSLPSVDAGPDILVKKGEEIVLKAYGANKYSWDRGVKQGEAFVPDSGGVYRVTGTDINGCMSSDEVLVTIENDVTLDNIPVEDFNSTQFRPVNVVFVLDISNSMEASNKLNLLKMCVNSLADIIRSEDKVTLVTYASQAAVIMAPKSGSESELIKKTVSDLRSMGSTAGIQGIKLGFKQARKTFIENGTNLVIVITDGAFDEHTGDYLKIIDKYQKQGIHFSVVGIKNAPKDEANMRQAAETGKGRYVPVFKASDTKENLIREIKKHAFKY